MNPSKHWLWIIHTKLHLKPRILVFFLLFMQVLPGYAQFTAPKDSYIIKMDANPTGTAAYRPYGMIHELVKFYKIPVYWIAKEGKAKDAIDYTINGVNYSAGLFVISSDYITPDILSVINGWKTGSPSSPNGYTRGQVTANIIPADYSFSGAKVMTISAVPYWTLNNENTGIAGNLISSAGIPQTQYKLKLPPALGACDDIFVMPHADPEWSNDPNKPKHENLYSWNLTHKGSIWAGCHAVSVLENLYNPGNTSQQMNFLSEKVGPPVANGNSLVLFGKHKDGSLPYSTNTAIPSGMSGTYTSPDDWVSQYLGISDGAHTNGSEQIYLPVIGGGWRTTTNIITFDPTQENVNNPKPKENLSEGVAAVIAYGRAFGDPERGWVMYEGGHDINGTNAANVAAVKAFHNWSLMATQGKVPQIAGDITGIPANGQILQQNLSLSVNASSPIGSTLTYKWTAIRKSDGVTVGTFSPNNSTTAGTTTFIPPVVSEPADIIFKVEVVDECDRFSVLASKATLIPETHPAITLVKTGQLSTDGNTITYTFTVKNTGDITLDPVTVVDNKVTPANIVLQSTTLAPSQSTIGTATYTVTASDREAGQIENSATATGTDTYGNTATDISGTTQENDIPTVVNIPQHPKIALLKTGVLSQDGNTVTYTFTVKNTGDVTLNQVNVTDPKLSPINVTLAANTLAPGEETTGTAVYTVKQGEKINGQVQNTATTMGTPPKGSNVTDISGTTFENDIPTTVTVPGADLGVVKTVSNANPQIGNTVTFTITATNHGPSNSTNVVVNDLIPAGYTVVNTTPSVGTWASPQWTISSLSNGASATLTVEATVNATGPYSNTATITGTEPDPNPSNNTSTVTPTVPALAPAIALIKTGVLSNNGNTITYTFTVKNTGNVTLDPVKVTDAKLIPTNVTLAVTSLAVGEETTGTATYTVSSAEKINGQVQNTATATGTPLVGSNVTDISGTTFENDFPTEVLIPGADLEVTKTINNPNPAIGSQIIFIITARNNGTANATGVKVNDVIPSGYMVQDVIPSTGNWNAPDWTIGNLSSGASTTLMITATVNTAGSYTNTAVISGNEPDPNPNNNTSTVTPTVPVYRPAIALMKTGLLSTNGNTVTYSFRVKNTGNVPLTGVTVTDPKLTPTSNVTLAITSLAVGEETTGTAIYTVTEAEKAAGSIQNTATASGIPPTGPNVTDQSGTTLENDLPTVIIVPETDLAVVKTVSNPNPSIGSQVVFTILATNYGPGPASGVKVTDVIPAGYAVVSVTSGMGTWSAPVWTIDNLAKGTNTYLTVIATVNATGPYTNTATITGIEPDSNLDNNTSTVTPTVPVSAPAIALMKTGVLNETDNTITYSFRVRNTGNVTLTAVTVTDVKLPGGITLGQTTLAPGAETIGTAIYTITPAEKGAGQVENTATATGTSPSGSNVTDISGTTLETDDPTVVLVENPLYNPDINVTYVNVPINGNLKTNDKDVKSGTTYGTPTPQPGNPANCLPAMTPASNNTTGAYTFTCATPGVFTYLVPVCESPGTCTDVPLVITVLDKDVPANNGPVANVDLAVTKPNTPVTLATLANDKSGDPDKILVQSSVSIITQPTNGTAVVDLSTGDITYTPANGFTGTDVLTYQVCDNASPAKCTTAQQVITVSPQNAPNTTVATDDYYTTKLNTTVIGNVKINDRDPEGHTQNVEAQSITEPGKGTLVLNPNGTFTFIPVTGYAGPVNFPYTTCDNGTPSACTSATLYILVTEEPTVCLPDFNPAISVTPSLGISGQRNMTVVLDIKELASCASQGTSPIRVTLNKVPHLSFVWDPIATAIPQAGVTGLENSDWNFTQTPTAWVWTYNKPVYNGLQISNIGFRGVWDGGATSGTADFNVSVINGSGGEVNYLNNVDFERVIWSFIP